MVQKTEGLFEHILIHYRWIFVCLFLLPLSFVFDIWIFWRNYIVFKLNSAPSKHDDKVKNIQRQIQSWNKIQGKKPFMCTARPGWQTMSFRQGIYKDIYKKINVDLVDILHIDHEKKTVHVEPLVNMGQLTAMLNPLGWTIPIVPELDDLTVGGLVMGTGIESSSHIHGLFQHICLSYELVLADGSVVRCSPENNPDLFYGIPWSYGTLGILTSVEVTLIPAKKYIELTYLPFKSLDAMSVYLEEAVVDDRNEFVEVLIFNENESVVMIGKQTDEMDNKGFNPIGRWYKPWFFKHVQDILNRSDAKTEYIPLRDYYHRHSRSIFWELQDIIPFGNNLLFRLILGWMVPPKISLMKLTQSETTKKLYENNHIIQDMLLPMSYLKETVIFFEEQVGVYPLWICPFKLPNNPGFLHPAKSNVEIYVDVGVYGVPKVENFKPRETTRKIEKFVMDRNGFQMLYADTYMTREEFRLMFDHSLYDKLRKTYGCEEAFPEVYQKVCKEARR
ncbi:delta(24)-sterol reductase-like [Coccinella septempunctata]|uniref:delta(24)-sterol reductase-like n=1 Tax=Coccinella septempunctata TaxID=41139 RepID=UPI001D05F84B|nr:delta(24)-sterol reductase-like [Coccinella septempunctata]